MPRAPCSFAMNTLSTRNREVGKHARSLVFLDEEAMESSASRLDTESEPAPQKGESDDAR